MKKQGHMNINTLEVFFVPSVITNFFKSGLNKCVMLPG